VRPRQRTHHDVDELRELHAAAQVLERGEPRAAARLLADSAARELDGLLDILEPAPSRAPALSS
jgi:hypothetical protein